MFFSSSEEKWSCWALLNTRHVCFFLSKKTSGLKLMQPGERLLAWHNWTAVILDLLYFIPRRWVQSLSLSHYLKRARSRRWRAEGKDTLRQDTFPVRSQPSRSEVLTSTPPQPTGSSHHPHTDPFSLKHDRKPTAWRQWAERHVYV